jgi:hypothetical protein
MSEPVRGEKLLALVKEMDGASKSELVRAAGYCTTRKDGIERLNFTGFYEALLEAKGTNFGGPTGRPSGRALSFTARVQFNGNLLIGKSYIRQMGFEPGDQFKIVLGKAGSGIRLVPVASDSEDDGPEDTAPAVCPAPAACSAPALVGAAA